jgi:hypothetical protein
LDLLLDLLVRPVHKAQSVIQDLKEILVSLVLPVLKDHKVLQVLLDQREIPVLLVPPALQALKVQ